MCFFVYFYSQCDYLTSSDSILLKPPDCKSFMICLLQCPGGRARFNSEGLQKFNKLLLLCDARGSSEQVIEPFTVHGIGKYNVFRTEEPVVCVNIRKALVRAPLFINAAEISKVVSDQK